MKAATVLSRCAKSGGSFADDIERAGAAQGTKVSDETIADAKEPLTIQWLDSSYIDLPVRK